MAKKTINSVDVQSGDIAVQWIPGVGQDAYHIIPITLSTSDNKTIDTSKVTVTVSCDTESGLSAIYDTTTGWTLTKNKETYNPSSALTITVKLSLSGYQPVEWSGQTVSVKTTNTTLTFIPATLSSEIARLTQAKADIKAAIEAKGVTVGDGTIDTYASKIGEISSGGSAIETGHASNLIFNIYFVPMGSVEENINNVYIPNSNSNSNSTSTNSLLRTGEINNSIQISADFSLNVNVSVIRSQYIAETDTRTTDIKVLLEYADVGTIYITSPEFSKYQTYTYTNDSAQITGYEDIENYTIAVYVAGLNYPANFSCRAVIIEE